VPVERLLVDTNVLVRFFSGEPPDMAARSRRLVERADAGEIVLVVVPVILAETFYTLESFYELDGKLVAARLVSFLNCRGIDALEKGRLLDALGRCESDGTHFADAFLAAVAIDNDQPIASFDRDFDAFRNVRRIEPN